MRVIGLTGTQPFTFQRSSLQRATGGRKVAGLPNSRAKRGHRVSRHAAATTSSEVADTVLRAFPQVSSEQQFFSVLEGLIEASKVPKQLLPVWKDFYNSYRFAVIGSGVPGSDERLVANIMSTLADRVLTEFISPYTFPSSHQRILEPYNYYELGQIYVSPLINYKTSVLGHTERWTQIQQQVEAGHNVVLLANHQTEADPSVFSLTLQHTHPKLATDVIYVAGDKVVTDALCKPFSMGRCGLNAHQCLRVLCVSKQLAYISAVTTAEILAFTMALWPDTALLGAVFYQQAVATHLANRNLYCVHSKKHLDDFPELKAAKIAQNRRTLQVMMKELNEGGRLLWISPHGGRDRPTPEGEWLPNEFDPSAVELMRQLTDKAAPPGHLHPLAMYSWEMMPPPPSLEKGVGERRITNYVGVGMSVCEELNVDSILEGLSAEDKVTRHQRLATVAWQATVEEYKLLVSAIKEPKLRMTNPQFVQPWLKQSVAA